MSLRIGHGLDAHRLAPGRPLMLGGVPIPLDQGLAGHSDGDAAAHALADACLGAAGLGTMGDHFPSTTSAGGASAAVSSWSWWPARLHTAGARVLSAQVVVVCAAASARPLPRVHGGGDVGGSRRPRPGTVVVGATSGDGLGAAGRGEGILASAVALLEVG